MAEEEPPGASVKPLVFRVDETTPEVVQSVLLERGWSKFDQREQNPEDWNLYWRTSPFRMAEHISVKPWQCLNHHPGTTRLTRKDLLARCLRHMQRLYGAPLYQFLPPTFVMPGDYSKFVAEYFQEKKALDAKLSYWICKPAELSRGRGIIIFSDIRNLIFADTCIIQKYICNPLLVGRYKCDLRVYVCVTGFKPLTIYIYREGLVRFATEKFDLGDLQNSYAHLTNSSINRSGASCEKVKEVVGGGCKWTLSRFFSYLRSWGADDLLLWQKISRVVILTVLAVAPSVPCAANCFELLGFDILIDDNLKPWLMEVNYSPGLSLDCSVDVSVKRRLIHDTIELIHLHSLRNEREESCRAADGSPGLSPARKDRGWGSDLPYGSFSQLGSRRASSEDGTPGKKAATARPESQHARQPREALRRQEARPPTREPSRAKPRATVRHPALKALVPRVPPTQSRSREKGLSPCAQPDSSWVPSPQAGNFVLIFPFNEATFGASRSGLNVRRIIQELQKLMHKQCSQVAEEKIKK